MIMKKSHNEGLCIERIIVSNVFECECPFQVPCDMRKVP